MSYIPVQLSKIIIQTRLTNLFNFSLFAVVNLLENFFFLLNRNNIIDKRGTHRVIFSFSNSQTQSLQTVFYFMRDYRV